MTSFALGLHTKLVKLGVSPQSNEYYESIDSRMREVFPDNFEDKIGERVEKPKRQSNVVAPATRSTAPKEGYAYAHATSTCKTFRTNTKTIRYANGDRHEETIMAQNRIDREHNHPRKNSP